MNTPKNRRINSHSMFLTQFSPLKASNNQKRSNISNYYYEQKDQGRLNQQECTQMPLAFSQYFPRQNRRHFKTDQLNQGNQSYLELEQSNRFIEKLEAHSQMKLSVNMKSFKRQDPSDQQNCGQDYLELGVKPMQSNKKGADSNYKYKKLSKQMNSNLEYTVDNKSRKSLVIPSKKNHKVNQKSKCQTLTALSPYNQQSSKKTENKKNYSKQINIGNTICDRLQQKDVQKLQLKLMKMKAKMNALQATVHNLQTLNKQLIEESKQQGIRLDNFASNTRNTIREKDVRIYQLEQQNLFLQRLIHEKQEIIQQYIQKNSKKQEAMRKKDQYKSKNQVKELRSLLKSKQCTIELYQQIIKEKEATIKKMADFNNSVCLKFLEIQNKNQATTEISNQKYKFIQLISNLQAKLSENEKMMEQKEMEQNQMKDLIFEMDQIIASQKEIIETCTNQLYQLNQMDQLNKVGNISDKNCQIKLELQSRLKQSSFQKCNHLDATDRDQLQLCDQSVILYKMIDQKEKTIKQGQQSIKQLKSAVQFWKKEYQKMALTLKSFKVDENVIERQNSNKFDDDQTNNSSHQSLSSNKKITSTSSSLETLKSMASQKKIICSDLIEKINQQALKVYELKKNCFQKNKKITGQKAQANSKEIKDKLKMHQRTDSNSTKINKNSLMAQFGTLSSFIDNDTVKNFQNVSRGLQKNQKQISQQIRKSINILKSSHTKPIACIEKSFDVQQETQNSEVQNKLLYSGPQLHPSYKQKHLIQFSTKKDVDELQFWKDRQGLTIKGSKYQENMTFGQLECKSKLQKVWSFSQIKAYFQPQQSQLKNGNNEFTSKENQNLNLNSRKSVSNLNINSEAQVMQEKLIGGSAFQSDDQSFQYDIIQS